MKFDINSYEIFLSGRLNPIRHTTFDVDARKAEKKFNFDIANFKDRAQLFIKIKLEDITKDPNKIDFILNELNLIEHGFEEGENISVAIDTEEIDEDGRIEIRIKSEEKTSFPSMDSSKTEFFEKEQEKIKSGIKKHLRQTTLSFETEEKVNAYVSQQYQFAHFYYNEFKRLRRSSVQIGESFNKFNDNKKPLETNAHILWFIMSDIAQLIRFMESNYPFYLKNKIIPLDEKVPTTTTDKIDTPIKKSEPSKWKTIFNVDNLELKPNFAGIGINLNELIKQWTTKR